MGINQEVAEVKGSRFPIRELLIFGGILLIAQIFAFLLFGDTQGPPRIAFMSDREGNFEIFIMATDGSEVANLTNDPGADGLPGWSSQENSLAFLTSRGDQIASIYRMDDEGLGFRLLVQDPTIIATAPIWSPDGDWVVYHSGDNVQVNIHIVDASGNEVREITAGASLNRFADWSPDGDQLMFLSNRDGQSAVYAVDLEGGEPTKLTDSQFASAMAVWSPDGEKIAFVTDRDGDVEIYSKDIDTDKTIRLTDSLGVDAYPKWSPDGSQIAFLSIRDGNPEIYVMNADGSDQKNLTNNPAQESVQGDFYWSLDGTQILFHTDRDGNPEVYLMDADGNNPVNLSNDPATDFGSVWVQ
jgi:Tol biopolymer transport system component